MYVVRINDGVLKYTMVLINYIGFFFKLTSSQTSEFPTPGLRFMIFNSADFSTPSAVNSTFGLAGSTCSTLTFLKYLNIISIINHEIFYSFIALVLIRVHRTCFFFFVDELPELH